MQQITDARGNGVRSQTDEPLLAAGYVLTPWNETDGREFTALLAREPDIASQMALDYYDTSEKLATAYARWNLGWESNGWGPYAIRTTDGQFVGFAGPHQVPDQEGAIWSGAIARLHRRRGLGTQAVEAIGMRHQLANSKTFARSNNVAVQKALQHSGWERLGDARYLGLDVVWFRRDWTDS